MAKRTTKTGAGTGERSNDEDAPRRAAPKRAAANKPALKKAAPKRAAARPEAEKPRAPRRPSRVAGMGTALREQANRLLAKADDEAVKAILTAGALAAAAVILGDKAADGFKDEDGPDGAGGTGMDSPAGRARLKAAAAAGGAAMGAQLLKTLDETRERKGLASGDDPFDPKALAVKAVAAFIK